MAKTVKKKKTAKTVRAKRKTVAKKSSRGTKSAKKSTSVAVGQQLPALSLPATGGKTVALQELRGKKVVLYFYPKDATPGCTLEGHDFTRLHHEFKDSNTEIFGISRDTIKSHESFKSCENYAFDLLSDEDETASKMFGVIKMKNMYGKQVRGIERSTFVIDSEGRLVKEWRGVKVPGHAEEVLEFVKDL